MAYGDYINSTLHKYGGDLARPTKFDAIIEFPAFMNSNNIEPKKINTLCKTVQIPEIIHEPIEIKYKGHNIKVRGRTNYNQTLSITFFLDDKHKLKDYFDYWITNIDNTNISYETEEKSAAEIYGSILIQSKDFDENSITHTYQFSSVYPTQIEGIAFNTEGVSSTQEITVTFSYLYYKSSKETTNFEEKFEGAKNKVINKVADGIGSVFGTSGGKVKRIVGGGIDIFRKIKG